MDTIELNGRTYSVRIEADETCGAPWEEHDGHGVVSSWERREKAPGEVIIASDHGSKRFYDVRATMAIARRDRWGLGDDDKARLAKRLGREPKRGDVVAEAVRLDCERMRQWCNDVWSWVGVVVTLLDEDGDETEHHASLWGIESDAGAYLDEVARELAEQIAGPIDLAALTDAMGRAIV